MNIEFSPEVETRLQNEARRRGQKPEDVVRQLVEENIPASNSPFYETASGEEWSKAFRQWAESHSHETPLLSEEAISRESIYGERG